MTYGNFPPDTGFIVGRPFKTGDGWCWPGEPAPDEVTTSANLYALVSSGFLYPYVPDKGYAYLPPHLYNAVRVYQEVNDIIARGEAPIEMDWTPPKKLQDAIDAKDAEELSKVATRVASPASAEDWTRKLEVNQISPRPVELPREELFTDSKKDEAEAAAEDHDDDQGDDAEVGGVIDNENREDELVASAEKAFDEITVTPQFTASEDNPLRPEFNDDEDLQSTFEEVQAVTKPSEDNPLGINTDDVSVLERQDPFNNMEYANVEVEPKDVQQVADEMREESERVREEQESETEDVVDPDIEPASEDLEDPVGTGSEEPTTVEPSSVEDQGDGESTEEGSYDSLTKEQLQEELRNRELPTSGNKPELVARLEEDDAE